MNISVLHPNQTWQWLTWRHALLIVVWIVFGLFWDAKGVPLWLSPQYVVNCGTFILWGYFFMYASKTERLMLVACTVFAILGESLLSLVWVVYHYQAYNLPLFVPPGHALLMLVGIYLMQYIPRQGYLWVMVLALVSVLPGLFSGTDQVSIWLFGVFVLTCLNKSGRPLYVVMLVLAGVMELYGTSLGNWVWNEQLPYFHLRCPNPPLLAGACYCVLDWMVSKVANGFHYVDHALEQQRQPFGRHSVLNDRESL
jgi:hypothetical protein